MKTEWKLLTLTAFAVCVLWGIFLLLTLGVRCGGNIEAFGQMGDAFNMLNSLFAGLAFAAVCFQLWSHQKQINEERIDRRRAERISALSTRIQVTFDKILHERELLLQVAPGFKNVSFLHEGDGIKTGEAIKAKEDLVHSLSGLIAEIEKSRTAGSPTTSLGENLKDLWDNQAALTMLKQIKQWVDQLALLEKEMDNLLKVALENEKED